MGALAIPLFLAVGGAGISAVGTIAGGAAEQQAANYQAAQMDRQATAEKAAAQREAQDQGKNARLALSRNEAVGAAGGFSTTDQSFLDQAGELAARGRFQQLLTDYGGEDRAAGLNAKAEGARMSGKAAVTGSYWKAASTIVNSASTFYGKYG